MSKRIYMYYLLQLFLLITIPYIISEKSNGEYFLKGDCFYYKAIVVSILEDGDLILDNNIASQHHFNGQLSLGKSGNLVPKHSIFMPIISSPFYYFLGNEGLLLFNIINCFTIIFLMYKLNKEFHRPLISFLTAIIYFPCTLFLYYSYNYSPDIFSTIFIISTLYFLFRNKFYLSTTLLGFSIFAKITNLILAVPILIYIMIFVFLDSNNGFEILLFNWKKKLVKLLTVLLIFFVSLFPFFYTNIILFGSPIESSYENIVISKDHRNNIIIDDCSSKFNQPFFGGAINIFFNVKNGIISTNPILLVSFLGCILLFFEKRADKKIFLLIILISSQILFFSKYDYWEASQFSNRFLMPMIVISSVFTGYFINHLIVRYQQIVSSK